MNRVALFLLLLAARAEAQQALDVLLRSGKLTGMLPALPLSRGGKAFRMATP